MSARRSSSLAPSAAVRTMKPPEAVRPLADQNALQPLALFVGRDLARDADVVDRRHVDQEASRQRDVAGDARALLADGLLGNLDQNLLAFLQQVADGGQVGGLHGSAPTAPTCVRSAAMRSPEPPVLRGRSPGPSPRVHRDGHRDDLGGDPHRVRVPTRCALLRFAAIRCCALAELGLLELVAGAGRRLVELVAGFCGPP